MTAATWIEFPTFTLNPAQSTSKTYDASVLGDVVAFWPKVFGPCLVTITRYDSSGDPEDPPLRIPYGTTSSGIQGQPVIIVPTGGQLQITVKNLDSASNVFGWLLETITTDRGASELVLPPPSTFVTPGNVNAGARRTIADLEVPMMTRLAGIATCTQAFSVEADWTHAASTTLTTWTETLATGAAGAVVAFDIALRSSKVLVAIRNTSGVAGTASGTARVSR